MFITPLLSLLSSAMHTPFLVNVFPVYQNLKLVSSTSFTFYPFHFVSWTQIIFTRCLIMVSTTSQSLPISDPTFQVPTRTLLGSASFLTLRIRQVKCEDTCSFFITPVRWCSTSLRIRWPDPCSLNTVYRSRYGAPSRGVDPTLAHLTPYLCSDMTRW
jgi:hypothetical protein